MSLILHGNEIMLPTGLEVVSWRDDPKVPVATDGNPRKSEAIQGIVLHTVHGKLGKLLPGSKASTRAEAYAKYQANTSRDVSWDFTIDTDGTVIQSNDPSKRYTWHAGSVNKWTIGIEFVQDDNGDVYEAGMVAGVQLIELLCANFGILKRVPVDSHGEVYSGFCPRLSGKQGPWSGVFAHCNQTTNRGPGDPGPHIFRALLAAGFEGWLALPA